ncbi:MAG TPA: hypothetical protein VES02_16765 [Dermatophilaceae bacterium]|nr:hypothetical protein [Dermatophilaceae bacterium]
MTETIQPVRPTCPALIPIEVVLAASLTAGGRATSLVRRCSRDLGSMARTVLDPQGSPIAGMPEQLLRRMDLTRLLVRRVHLDALVARVALGPTSGGRGVLVLVEGLHGDSPAAHVDLESLLARVAVDRSARRLDVDLAVLGLRGVRKDSREPEPSDEHHPGHQPHVRA